MNPTAYIQTIATIDHARVVVLRSHREILKGSVLQLWDMTTGHCVFDVSVQADHAFALAVSSEAGIAVTGDRTGVVRVWSLRDGACQRTIPIGRGPICALAFIGRGREILVACGNGFSTWNLERETCAADYAGHAGAVVHLAVVPGAGQVLSASHDRTVRLWDFSTGACVRTFVEPNLPVFVPRYEAIDPQGVTGVCVLGDGLRAVSCHGDGTLRCWNLASGELLHKVQTGTGDLVWLLSVSASASDDRILAGSFDTNLWEWTPGGAAVPIRGHVGEVMAAQFLGTTRAVSGSFDQTLRVWDLERRKCLRVIGKAIRSSQWPPSESRW